MKISALLHLRKISIPAIASGAIGLAWGFLILGLGPVNPFNVDWLRRGDLASAQINLLYFRQTAWLQWPLTDLPNYGVGWPTLFSSSGVFLLGVITKLFDSILPMQFQYIGPWILLCFVLQGVFARRLIGRYTQSELIRLICAGLFVVAPILSFRADRLGHHDLTAHWLVLLAIDMYHERRPRTLRWLAVLVLALSINPYLFALVLSVFVSHVVASQFSVFSGRTASWSIGQLAYIAGSVAVAYAALGFLSLGSGLRGSGFFRINALSYFYPANEVVEGYSDSYSWIFDRVAFGQTSTLPAGGGEGFVYLGAGVVLGLLVTSPAVLWLRGRNLREHVPLVFVAVLLFLIGISNRVVVGRHEFSFSIPSWLFDLRQVFRVAGRLSWLLYYLIVLACCILSIQIFRRFRIVGSIAITLILIVQVLDQLPAVRDPKSGVLAQRQRWNMLQDSNWQEWSHRVDRVYIYPTFDLQGDLQEDGAQLLVETNYWSDILWWAAENNLPINFAYHSRPVADEVERENRIRRAQLRSGELDVHALYIFPLERDFRMVDLGESDAMSGTFVDGLWTIYPTSNKLGSG